MVNSRAKGLLIVVVSAVAVACGFWALTADDEDSRHQGPMVLEPAPPRPAAVEGPSSSPDVPIVVTTAGARGRQDAARPREISQALRAFSAESLRDTVTGLVRDEEGERVAGATVTARLLLAVGSEDTGGEVVASTVTDEDGAYTVGGFLRVGERYVIDVSHDAYAVGRSGVVDPLDPATATQDLVLREGVSIRGSVRDRVGAPLGGAVVAVHDLRLSTRDPGAGPERQARTDLDGNYVLEHLRPGVKRVVVGAQGMTTVQRMPVHLRADLADLSFRLNPGRVIAGSVVDAGTGAGVRDVVLRARAVAGSANATWTARTDANGAFRLTGVAEGLHNISIVEGPGLGIGVNARGGEQDVKLAVEPRCRVEGVVMDGATGQPVTSFSVSLTQATGPVQVMDGARQREQHPRGAFSTSIGSPGRYRVLVEAPGFAIGVSRAIELEVGRAVTGVVIELERGVAVQGRVVTPSGDPIASARLFAVQELELAPNRPGSTSLVKKTRVNARRSVARTFTDGSYVLPNLGRGRFHLQVGCPPLFVKTRTDSFELGGGEQMVALTDVVLQEGASVTGVVFDPRGSPDYNAFVTAVPRSGRPSSRDVASGGTDARGRYRIDGLVPGTYTLRVTRPQRSTATAPASADGERSVILRAGLNDGVDFRLP